MSAALHHALLALAVVGLAETALRIASQLAPSGLERAIVTVTLGVSVALVEALVLGLVGLGTNTIALVAAAAVTWAAGLVLLPAPEVRPRAELGRWWSGLDLPGRAAAAALAGFGVAWTAWQLRYPSIGFDSGLYHYVQIAGWVQNGRPGSILELSYDLPYGNYPLTDEVVLSWFAGISRSFVPLVLWNPAMLVLLGVAAWVTLRNLAVARVPAALATAALVTLPLAVHQLNEPQTDLPALAWLACVAALCTGAGRTPALLAPALLAAGLAVGTKTTPAVLVAVALAVGVHLARGRLRAVWPWLALGAAGAFAVGGLWYARNLVQHGSPLWPFAAAPWGDPRPPFLELVDTRLLERLGATLDGRWGTYTGQLAGAVVLLAGALAGFLRAALGRGLARPLRLGLLVAGAATIVAFLAWSMAPGTGLPTAPGLLFPQSWPSSTVRYLLPALGAATIAVALASRFGGLTGTAASAGLAAAVVWNLVKDAELGLPYVPSAQPLVLGAAGGLLLFGAGLVAWRAPTHGGRSARALPGGLSLVVGAVLAGVVLAQVSEGFVERHARVTGSTALGQGVAAWFTEQPRFESGMTVAFASRGLQAALAGDHLTNELELIPAREPCVEVRARARHSAIVISEPEFLRGLLGVRPYHAQRCLARRQPDYKDGVFKVYLPSRSAG